MKNRLGIFLALALVLTVVTSCKKTISFRDSAAFMGDPPDYYMTMKLGKYVIYRLDSINFYSYGQFDTTTSYLAKDSVEKSIVDGEGNQAWLVTRYLSDTTGQSWAPSGTFTVTPSSTRVYVSETNLRFLKLASPIDEGFTWQGNSALPDDPYQDFYQFSDDFHLGLNGWTYTYQHVGEPYTVGATKFDSTATVLSAADSVNVPIKDTKSFASKTYWVETYAKHVGLVYRYTAIWEYQPPTPNGSQSGYKIGFEMTLKLIDHN